MAAAVQLRVALVSYTLGFVLQEVGRSPAASPEAVESSPVRQRALAALGRQPVKDRYRAGLVFILDGAAPKR
jgi:hypothetical protein